MSRTPALHRWFTRFGLLCSLTMVGESAFSAEQGLITRTSRWSVDETVEKIVTTAKARGLTLFATFDHAANARSVGLTMPPTIVLVLGNPKGGTPVMIASPLAAIDLPLKVLVAQDASGATVVTINDPAFVVQRHGLAAAMAPAVSGLGPLIEAALQ